MCMSFYGELVEAKGADCLAQLGAGLMADDEEQCVVVGFPVVVYGLLTPTVWTRATGMRYAHVEEAAQIRGLFLERLGEVLEQVAAAGIIHTDLRLPNLFYRIARLENGTPVSVDVRIIDWDDSLHVGATVPQQLLDVRSGRADFPDSNAAWAKVAQAQYHAFFLRELASSIRV